MCIKEIGSRRGGSALCQGQRGCRAAIEGRVYESVGSIVYISEVKQHLYTLCMNVCVCAFDCWLVQCVIHMSGAKE